VELTTNRTRLTSDITAFACPHAAWSPLASLEETMPNLPIYQEQFAGIKRQIYQAMQAIGNVS
jgi:hypothetical protein